MIKDVVGSNYWTGKGLWLCFCHWPQRAWIGFWSKLGKGLWWELGACLVNSTYCAVGIGKSLAEGRQYYEKVLGEYDCFSMISKWLLYGTVFYYIFWTKECIWSTKYKYTRTRTKASKQYVEKGKWKQSASRVQRHLCVLYIFDSEDNGVLVWSY